MKRPFLPSPELRGLALVLAIVLLLVLWMVWQVLAMRARVYELEMAPPVQVSTDCPSLFA